jgi:hypothetical protein
MSDTGLSSLIASVIGLCDAAFPQISDWEPEVVRLCRRYETQVIVPLSNIPMMGSEVLAGVLGRIGWFLNEDGMYQQAIEIRLQGSIHRMYSQVNGFRV